MSAQGRDKLLVFSVAGVSELEEPVVVVVVVVVVVAVPMRPLIHSTPCWTKQLKDQNSAWTRKGGMQ